MGTNGKQVLTITKLSQNSSQYIQNTESDVNRSFNETTQSAYDRVIQNIDRDLQEIQNKQAVSYQQQSKKGGCYVATCVYGSYDCPEVWTLRRYRDDKLAKSWYGRAFIHSYYAISPTIVKLLGNTGWFKRICRRKLNRIIDRLQENGVESTPYNDRDWQ